MRESALGGEAVVQLTVCPLEGACAHLQHGIKCLEKNYFFEENFLLKEFQFIKSCSTNFSTTLYGLPCFYTNDIIDLLP